MSKSSSMSNPVYGNTAARNRRLVLYYDTTNTIVMKDTSTEPKSVQMNVARLITRSAWGRVTSEEDGENGLDGEIAPNNWQLAHDALSWAKPEVAGDGDQFKLKTYEEYLNETYPLNVGDHVEANAKTQKERTLAFAMAGGPGQKFKKTQEKMLACLELPKAA